MGKNKTMDFSETIVVYDIKVGRCSQLNEYMKLYEYQRSRSFIDLVPNHSDSVFLNFFSSITTDFNISSAQQYSTNGPLVTFFNQHTFLIVFILERGGCLFSLHWSTVRSIES